MKKIFAVVFLIGMLLTNAYAGYGDDGPYLGQVTHTTFNGGISYYPEGLDNTKVVFFVPGAISVPIQDKYNSLLEHIAGYGYTVIAGEFNGNNNYSPDVYTQLFEQYIENHNGNFDMSRIGIIGHSAGGAQVFKILQDLKQDKQWGNEGRFIMALEPWFAFGSTQDSMRNLPDKTNMVFMQWGVGGNNEGNGTDARITLTEYYLANSQEGNKVYNIYENADHSLPQENTNNNGDMKEGLLKQLDALMDYTLEGTNAAYNIAFAGSTNPQDGFQVLNPKEYYGTFGCNNSQGDVQIYFDDIDHCAANLYATTSSEITTYKENYAEGESVWIEVKNKPGNAQDWIGIYPAGASSNGANIVAWRWASQTSLTTQDPGDWYKFSDHVIKVNEQDLAAGNYEARFFLNNSYNVDASVAFSVGNGGNNIDLLTYKDVYSSGESVWIEVKNKPGNIQDWIGIYPAGTSNSWNNVVAWRWASQTSETVQDLGDWYKFSDHAIKANEQDLASGNYEARFFLNNSYDDMAIIPFTVQ